ncbi:uncharacterized protein LOC144114688 isoform X2 [Amblyomma americanum]
MQRLRQWGIVPSGTCEMRIEGYCEANGELLITANVKRRISRNRIVCADGSSYKLVGKFDVISGLRGRIPSRILDKFVHGVPSNWRQVVWGWSRPAENTDAGIYRKDGNNASRKQLCIAQPRSPKKRRDAVLNTPQLRPRTRTKSFRDGSVTEIPNLSTAKTQLTIASGEVKADAFVKDVKVVVEKLPLSSISRLASATGVMKPSYNTASVAPSPVVKTRKQSAESNVPACTRKTRSGRAACLQENDRLTRARKKTATTLDMRRTSASRPPARASAGTGTKTEVCLDTMLSPARSASAWQNLSGDEQGTQGVCEVYRMLEASTPSKLAKRRMQDVPAVRRKISQQRLACAASTPAPSQAKLTGQVPRRWEERSNGQGLRKDDKENEEPKPINARRPSNRNRICSDREVQRAPEVCQAGSGQGVQTRQQSRASTMELGEKRAPRSLCVLPFGHNLNLDSSLNSASSRKETGVLRRGRSSCDIVKKQQAPARTLRTNSNAVISGQHLIHATLAANGTEPPSGKRKLRERSLSGHQDVVASKKNVFSTCKSLPVKRKRAASSSPGMLPGKRRSARILAKAKTAKDVIENQSSARKRKQSEKPKGKVYALSNSANRKYCRQLHKRELGASVGLWQRNRKGESRKEPGINPPDAAKVDGSNITEKAASRPVLPMRVTPKSVQLSTKQEFKNDDKEREKPKSQDSERSSDEKSTCNGHVMEGVPEHKGVGLGASLSECRIAGRSIGPGDELAFESLCTLPARRRLKLDVPHETAAGRQEANVQCRTHTLRSYPVIKQQKPAKTRRRNSSTVINSHHAMFKTGNTQQMSDQQNLGERSLSGHQNAGASSENILCDNQQVPTMRKRAAALSSGMPSKKKTACNSPEVKSAGNAGRKNGSAVSIKRKQSEQLDQQVCSNAANTAHYEPKCPAEARGFACLTENKKVESQKPSKLGATHVSNMGNSRIVKPKAESSPSKKQALASKAQNQDSDKPKAYSSPSKKQALASKAQNQNSDKPKAESSPSKKQALASKDQNQDSDKPKAYSSPSKKKALASKAQNQNSGKPKAYSSPSKKQALASKAQNQNSVKPKAYSNPSKKQALASKAQNQNSDKPKAKSSPSKKQALASKAQNQNSVKSKSELSPSKKQALASKAQNQDSELKPSRSSPQLTKALLAVTARKGTLKRKAQIRNLADALAANDACDDFYHDRQQTEVIPSNFFEDCWDELSVCRLSGMKTPTLNSPLFSNPRTPMSAASVCSTSTLPSPTAMDAIVQGIQKREKAVALPSITPKPKRKQQNLKTVLEDLQKLEKKLKKSHLKENCADSDEDSEESDSDSDSVFTERPY